MAIIRERPSPSGRGTPEGQGEGRHGSNLIAYLPSPCRFATSLSRWERERGMIVFVGHFAVALAAKSAAPRVSLATLILAAAFSDVLWIAFFVLGIEQVVI